MSKKLWIEKCQARGIKVVSRDTIETLRLKFIEDHLQNPNKDVLDTMKRKYNRAIAYAIKKPNKAQRYLKRVEIIAKDHFGKYASNMLMTHRMLAAA